LRNKPRGGAVLTRALVHAAAMDAAKASMRAAGRSAMNDEDADRFHAVFEALFQRIGGSEGWLELESI
jgi:hypothetical protein